MPACVTCGEAAGECGLCDACIADRTRAERTAQGLDPTVTDPAALDRIATVLRPKADRPAA